MRTDEEEFARPARPPETASLTALREAARHCTACHLYKRATQTVFGEGPKGATMMLVGEQPGDYEDVAGKPFVGPAGKIMDRALEEAGIDRSQVYVTNAVKHFKWEPRGKRRIHQKPNSREIAACRPWLEAELRIVKPKLVVAMGATAAHANAAKYCHLNLRRGSSRLFIHHLSFGSPTRHRASANTSTSSAIFVLRCAQPAKNKGCRWLHLFDRRCVSVLYSATKALRN